MHVVRDGSSTDNAGNLEQFISQIPDYALFMLDISGHVISWNAGAQRLKGYSAQEIMGQHFSVFYTPEDQAAEKPRHALDIAFREGTYQEEGWRVRKDGIRFWSMVTITALKDEEGKPQGFAKLVRDFTERKVNEAARLRANEAKYRAIFENSHDAIFLTRPEDDRLVAANPAACKLFGYSEQELTSMRREQLLDIADPRLATAYVQRQETGEGAAELGFIRKGGERFEARISSKLFTDENGQQMATTNIHDISERKQAEEALGRSEERFRLLYENAPIGIIEFDRDGHLVSANERFLEIGGYSPEEVIGFTTKDLTLPEDNTAINDMAMKLICGEIASYSTERRLPRKDGNTIWVRVTARMMHDKQGKPRGGIALYEDITERKQAEDALRQSEERFRLLYENAPLGIIQIDQNGYVTSANQKFAEISGYSPEEAVGILPNDVTLPEDHPDFLSNVEDFRAGKTETFKYERRLLRKDGTTTWVSETGKLTRDQQGKPQWGILVLEDITERKQANEALRQSEERFRLLYENAPIGIADFDLSGRCTFANRKLGEIVGYPPEEVVGHSFLDFTLPEERNIGMERFEKLISGELHTIHDERRALRKDGNTIWVHQIAGVIHDKLDKPLWGIAIYEDVTEKKQAEEALRQSEDRFRLLYESAPIGITHFDLNGYCTFANREMEEIVGYPPEEIVGLSYLDITPPDEKDISIDLMNKLVSGEIETSNRERRVLRKDGSTTWVRQTAGMMRDKRGNRQCGIAIFEDITERKQAEEALRQSEERFRLLYENAPIGIAHFDENRCLTSVNSKFAEISGYAVQEAVGLSYLDVTLPEERATSKKFVEELLAGNIETMNQESHLLRKDGSTTLVYLSVRIIRDIVGKPQSGIAIFEDITERKQAEEALRGSEEKFRATFEHAPLGIAECTVEGRFIKVNSKLIEILGHTKDELTGLTITDVTHPGDREGTLFNLQKLAKGAAASYVMEKRYIRKDHSFVWVNATVSLTVIHGKPPYLILAAEDITARKKAEENLKTAIESSYHQATHDLLTGLANRASFNDRLKEALAYAQRDGHRVAVHLLDLDRFKSINDTLGHHVGDLLLKDVAKRIKSHVRATDLAARLGGDEFVVIQTHLTDAAAAGVLAGKLVEDLGRRYFLEDQEVHSGTSIGIAVYPDDTEDPEGLVKQADLALYDAKNRGRFNYQFYRQELGAAFHEAQRLEQELARALRENQFFLHYQPQFDLKNGRIVGIEALLRWAHPTRGLVAAGEFVLEAERARLMLPIGEWTLRTACRQHKEWIDFGLAVPLTMNISSMQLRDMRLVQMLRRVLEETGLPPPFLQLEVRESVLWDPKISKNILNALKDSGIRLALEDFGTDMTALSVLDRIPLDSVKPGLGLVSQLPSNAREAALLAAIIGVAHNRKISVCAAGVETDNQFAAVIEQGCDSAQGYLLSSPLDTDQMKRLIDQDVAHMLP